MRRSGAFMLAVQKARQSSPIYVPATDSKVPLEDIEHAHQAAVEFQKTMRLDNRNRDSYHCGYLEGLQAGRREKAANLHSRNHQVG